MYNCYKNSKVFILKKLFNIFNYFFIGVSFLASKKVVVILTICLFINLLQVSTGYREELLEKEQEMLYEKVDNELKQYQESEYVINKNSISAVSNLISCYQEKISENDIPEVINNYATELKKLYNSNSQYFSFLYQDLYTGYTISYNEDSPIFTASTIKAPAMIYFYELASKNEIDLNEKLVYEKKFYSGGSGVLKTKQVGTSYTIEQLIEYAIHDSDNIAYKMLMNYFSKKDILEFWQNKGTKNIYTLDTIWGITSAKDASIYMRELYDFYQKDEEYGGRLMKYFQNAEWKLITDKNGNFNTANKGGWSEETIHDVAIVLDKNPYILVIMSNTGYNDYVSLFKKTSELVGNLHNEYWKYKAEVCNKYVLD